MSRHILRRFVLVFAALVLALAATLKLLAVVTDPMWREVAVIPPMLFLFAAVGELLVAAILFRAAALQTPDTRHQTPDTRHSLARSFRCLCDSVVDRDGPDVNRTPALRLFWRLGGVANRGCGR